MAKKKYKYVLKISFHFESSIESMAVEKLVTYSIYCNNKRKLENQLCSYKNHDKFVCGMIYNLEDS